ncbi:hypothetical protein Pla110_38020 [Polystyrenella longa]|uniref:Uncharacterized protein n=1 Tax=Polystyrenella longa TaxID=2528007 RepID=A0A518CS35_9PLAN|nr:hypothetical protein [Polystyrenella longa]QDU82047.1 hypothetical protein Pla110_38020 [Polystyrenella longa]
MRYAFYAIMPYLLLSAYSHSVMAEWEIQYGTFGNDTLPKQWKATMYTTEGSIMDSITTVAKEYKVNQDYEPPDFQIEVNPGDQIVIAKGAMEYETAEVQEDGSFKVIGDFPIRNTESRPDGVPASDRDADEEDPAISSNLSLILLCVWLLPFVLVAAIFFLVMRRSKR